MGSEASDWRRKFPAGVDCYGGREAFFLGSHSGEKGLTNVMARATSPYRIASGNNWCSAMGEGQRKRTGRVKYC